MPDTRLTAAFARDAAVPALWTAAGVSGLAMVSAGVRLLWEAAAPDPASWSVLVALAVPLSWGVALPAAGAVGAVAALARWTAEGAWTGARAGGVAGRRLVGAALLLGVAAGATTATMTLFAEPQLRAVARDVLARSGDIRLQPGVAVDLGGLSIRPLRQVDGWVEDCFVATDSVVGTARRARTVRTDGGLAIELVDGVAAPVGDVPYRVSWQRWVHPLPSPGPPRVELAELSNAELAQRADRTASSGRDAAYERAVLYKRFWHPVAALLFPLALLPMGARRRPALAVGLAGVGYLVAVRAGDHLATWVGAAASSMFGPGFLIFAGAVLWATWRDR